MPFCSVLALTSPPTGGRRQGVCPVTNLKPWSLPLLAAALTAGACMPLPGADNVPPAAPEAETIAISVGPCFGFCPVYNVTIAPEGAVRFQGLRHTAVLGEMRREAGTEATAPSPPNSRPIARQAERAPPWNAIPPSATPPSTRSPGAIPRAARPSPPTIAVAASVKVSDWTRSSTVSPRSSESRGGQGRSPAPERQGADSRQDDLRTIATASPSISGVAAPGSR